MSIYTITLKRVFKLNLNEMDEIIEVKEGYLNIQLGIQILPETNEDEELMSEEEKADFIKNTTITWFKDDQKLDQKDPEVCKLFQFTYDQDEGFHRLVVRKATKETEGIYTCLVENESGTSSCSTQLVVGPGNKPKLSSQLQDVTVYVGQSLEFRLKSSGLPPIDTCQWFKDDQLIVEMSSSSASNTVTSSANKRISMSRDEELKFGSMTKDEDKVIIFKLAIEDLKLDDTARYKCRIVNEHGYDETECQVKVLQEIIEEHEEVEETIEETVRLGGGKKSTREQEEEEQTETVVTEIERRRDQEEEEQQQRQVKRQRQEEGDVEMASSEGSGPQFLRKLKGLVVEEEEETIELVVSTRRQDRWSEQGRLKLRWLVDETEIVTSSSEHQVENFSEQNEQEWIHKLIIKTRSGGQRRRSSLLSSSSASSWSERVYRCEASNEFGEAQTSCQVKRRKVSAARGKPVFLRQLEDTETRVGETVVLSTALDVESAGEPDDVRFLKDGQLIYSSRSDGEQRDISSVSQSRIRIRSYEKTIEVSSEETTTSSYTRRRSRAGVQQRRAKVYEVSIENVQVDQMGSWECQASNDGAGSSSCRADLEVFAEPKIVTDLEPAVRVSPAKEIRLSVEASGSPIPVYSWFKDGLGIAEEERVFTETTRSSLTRRRSSVTSMRTEDGVSISGETLIIKEARPDDAGVYTCKVENRLGQVKSRDCSLAVEGDGLNSAPRIIRDFSRDQLLQQVEEGDHLVLKVLAEGHPRPRQHWFKDSEEIVETVSSRFEIENEGQEYRLKVRRSELSDSGKYRVVLRNQLGQAESRLVEVRVRRVSEASQSERRPSAPSILADAQDKTVGLGSNVSFDVQVAGHPKPLITWYKNGRRLTESADGRVSFVEEEETIVVEESEEGERSRRRKESTTVHRLVIEDVRQSDEAIYSLKAENEHGSSKSTLVSLTVDKRLEAVDETSERRAKQRAELEETTTTVTTTTTRPWWAGRPPPAPPAPGSSPAAPPPSSARAAAAASLSACGRRPRPRPRVSRGRAAWSQPARR